MPDPTTTVLPTDRPELRLRHRGSRKLTELQVARRQKVLDRIEVTGQGRWRWTGQAKTARGQRYPQVLHSLPGGATQLLNARHVIFYLATGWVAADVQQYRTRDGDSLNIHPDNLVPTPPLNSRRKTNRFWDTRQLRAYYG
ncbi:MAG: hypothetical protein O3B04_07525 [Chloroflexi bacterium]|nr:hypothetical protein [Chloroflexota bacterium]